MSRMKNGITLLVKKDQLKDKKTQQIIKNIQSTPRKKVKKFLKAVNEFYKMTKNYVYPCKIHKHCTFTGDPEKYKIESQKHILIK